MICIVFEIVAWVLTEILKYKFPKDKKTQSSRQKMLLDPSKLIADVWK